MWKPDVLHRPSWLIGSSQRPSCRACRGCLSSPRLLAERFDGSPVIEEVPSRLGTRAQYRGMRPPSGCDRRYPRARSPWPSCVATRRSEGPAGSRPRQVDVDMTVRRGPLDGSVKMMPRARERLARVNVAEEDALLAAGDGGWPVQPQPYAGAPYAFHPPVSLAVCCRTIASTAALSAATGGLRTRRRRSAQKVQRVVASGKRFS